MTVSGQAAPHGLAADFDGDGVVGFGDFFLFADAFGRADPQFDLSSNGKVEFDDFFLFADRFGSTAFRGKLLALAHERLGLSLGPALEDCYPNPFNASTKIRYRVVEPGLVSLTVYGLTGQVVRQLVGAHQEAGIYETHWDGQAGVNEWVASGTYILRLESGGGTAVRRVTLVK